MEEQNNALEILDRLPRPGFCVRENKIIKANQAAAALLLSPGQDIGPLMHTGSAEYAGFQTGQICLTLSIAGQEHAATVIRMTGMDLFLLDQEEDLEEFRSMALVSMELRTPLMNAIASAKRLSDDPGSPDAAKLNRSLMQMMRLVCNMSDVGRRPDAARMETRDVDAFLLELFEKAQTLSERKASLSYEGLGQPVFTLMDPEKLERAVWNILSNCIRFLPEGGRIQARLTRHGCMLHMTVQDNGSGIAEEVRGTLFHRYLRQPGIEDSRYGLGLGLSIIRSAAASHGGTVLIDRCGETGTRITMTIAIRQDDTNLLRSPIFRPDYAGGWDHGLVELSDCLSPELYGDL